MSQTFKFATLSSSSPTQQPQVPKRKRGRPPKKTPIDTQTMTTTPYVSVGSSMPTQLSQSSYSFQFDSSSLESSSSVADTHTTTPPPSSRKSSNKRKSISPQISSSPPTASEEGDHTLTTHDSGLGINFGNTTAREVPISTPPHCRSHVDPSLIFQASQVKSDRSGNNFHHTIQSSPLRASSSSFAGAFMVSPATPKTFGSIISSSPLYPSYYQEEDEDCNFSSQQMQQVATAPQLQQLQPGTLASSPPLQSNSYSPVRTVSTPPRAMAGSGNGNDTFISQNASARKAICERRNASTLSLSRSHSMRRLSTAPSGAPGSFGLRNNGPLSAPIRSASMYRSHSLKRRVSLNVTKGRAVVDETANEDDATTSTTTDNNYNNNDSNETNEDNLMNSSNITSGNNNRNQVAAAMTRTYTEPISRYTHRRHTIYDQSIDYINDNARRMSLESLFPELSPATTQPSTMPNSSATPPSSASLSETTSLKDLHGLSIEDSDEENDNRNDYDEEEEQHKNDARDALKKALERNSSTKSLDQLYNHHSSNGSSVAVNSANYSFSNTLQYPEFALPVIY